MIPVISGLPGVYHAFLIARGSYRIITSQRILIVDKATARPAVWLLAKYYDPG
jgi:hypothetical protein